MSVDRSPVSSRTVEPHRLTMSERHADKQFETMLYGISVDGIKENHDAYARMTTEDFVSELCRKLMERASKQLNNGAAANFRDKVEQSTERIVDEALKNLARKNNATIERNMSLPKYVVLPGYEDLSNPTAQDEALEKKVEREFKELELVHNQQLVMLEALNVEKKSYDGIGHAGEIDSAIALLIMDNGSGDDNGLRALYNMYKEVQSDVNFKC